MNLPEDEIDEKFLKIVEYRLKHSNFGEIRQKYYGKFEDGRFFIILTAKLSKMNINDKQIDIYQIHLIYENDLNTTSSPVTLTTQSFYKFKHFDRRKHELKKKLNFEIKDESALESLNDLLNRSSHKDSRILFFFRTVKESIRNSLRTCIHPERESPLTNASVEDIPKSDSIENEIEIDTETAIKTSPSSKIEPEYRQPEHRQPELEPEHRQPVLEREHLERPLPAPDTTIAF